MSKEKIKILLVDDHKMIREGIKAFLVDNEDYHVIGEAADGAIALQMFQHLSPDLILVDILMPELNGIDLTTAIRLENHQVKIIALTMVSENHHIKQMMKAGANGYLLKNCTEKELNDAITEVMKGNTYYSKEVTDIILRDATKQLDPKKRLSLEVPLTTREQEVLHLICKEYSNAEISDELFIGMRTVDAHKRNLLEKTGCKNVAGLVIYAIERELFDDL
ncbi:response regulator transcription factor [Reichenbachiella agarivorans]|uniref:Response regulator transcription factor n=1 Tax=Reichenbachiella agarivorans TaxID=2979464 RepID=A0ABY6CMJ3_9BACT|nr:response regulator transcription factor [Reichenbachiella agarivorans]UXP31727.1 response regulator transcription factor [Reichenbachiella agarivorans]